MSPTYIKHPGKSLPGRLFVHLILLALILIFPNQAAEYDWYEGTGNGATRDFYNREADLPWNNFMGDWWDADNVSQGNNAYASIQLIDNDTPKWEEWDVTDLVREWINGTWLNKGMFLRPASGGGTHVFASREATIQAQRPCLVVITPNGTDSLRPAADTYFNPSTYRGFGNAEELRVSGNDHSLLRFDLQRYGASTTVTSARLRLYSLRQYSTMTSAGIFRCDQGFDQPLPAPIEGIAAHYTQDVGIERDANVIFATGFESANWEDEWSTVQNPSNGQSLSSDPANLFAPLLGKAVRSRIPNGSTSGMSLIYKFSTEIGQEPEEIYFRYYLRLGNSWTPHISGGKMPGISGTYGRAGWGGRKVNGYDGWSARGSFAPQMSASNPLAPKDNPMGYYCYHADMPGTYGDIWTWTGQYQGYLENNQWYCVEEYCQMNTPKQNDGILRTWVDGRLAFEKTDIRFRDTTDLKIEQIWMNIYHGGTNPTDANLDLYFDNVVIAKQYIGPANGVSAIHNVEQLTNQSNRLTLFSNKIQYSIIHPGPVQLTVYNPAGQVVRSLMNKHRVPGSYRLNWNGRSDRNMNCAAGMLILRMQTLYWSSHTKFLILQ